MPGSDGAPARPGDASPPAVPIRLSLTLPGSASLGAYQAGAVSALAVTVNALRQRGRPVRLDAIGGASAGSIVALLFTHCLLTGRDAPDMLGRAWIDEVDIGLLRSGGGHSPLAFDDLRERMVHFLADEDRHPRRVHPPLDAPVTLQVSLTDLLGRSRAVEIGTGPTELLSYADWLEFELRPDHDAAALTDGGASTEGTAPSVLDAVLASASHPGAFPPVLVDGDRWCTDGGLVESRPVQRVVAAAQRRAGRSQATRLHGLGSHRVAPADVDAVRTEVAAARPFDPAPGDLPAEGIEQLGALGRWRLALLALQFGRVLTQQALRPPMARVRHWVGAA